MMTISGDYTVPITNDYNVLGDKDLWELLCDCMEPKQNPNDPETTLTPIDNITKEPICVVRFVDGEVRAYNPPSEIPS